VVGALGVITISRECFERCYSNQKTPPYHSNLSFVTLRNRRPTLLRASAYRTPSEASPRRRCGHASRRSVSKMLAREIRKGRGHGALCAIQLGLYTRWSLTLLYGAWHTRGGSRGNHRLRDIGGGRNTRGRHNGAVSCP